MLQRILPDLRTQKPLRVFLLAAGIVAACGGLGAVQDPWAPGQSAGQVLAGGLACARAPGTATPTPRPTGVATLMVAKFVDKQQALPGDVLQYTLVVMNDQLDGQDPGTNVRLTDSLPATLELVLGSLGEAATYDAEARTIQWSGQVPRGLNVELTFLARLTPAAGEMRSVINTLRVTDAFGHVREASAQTQMLHGTVTPVTPATPATAAPSGKVSARETPHPSERVGPLPTGTAKATPGVHPSATTPPTVAVSPTPTPAAMPTPRPEPRGMELVGYLASAPAQVLAVDGDLAFVGLGIELAVLDVSDTSGPRRLDYLVLGGPVLDIAVAGDVVYVAAGDNAGLYIIDASRPADLAVLKNLYAFSPLSGVAASGDYAFVSTHQLHVLDVAEPASPVEVATHEYPQDLTAAGKVTAVQGGHAYTLYRDYINRTGGFRIVDVSAPTAPVTVGEFQAGAAVHDMVVAGDYAFLLVGETVPHLAVADISDPTSPFEIPLSKEARWSGSSLAAVGGYLYLAYAGGEAPTGGLRILDIADASRPAEVACHDGIGPEIWELAISGRHAFITTGEGLLVLDVGVSSTPALAGAYTFDRVTGFGRDLVVEGDYALVGGGPHGLQVVDISDPVRPAVVSQIDTGGHTWAVALDGNYVYLADEYNGLRVIDVSDPLHPLEVGFYDVPGPYEFFHGVAVEDGYAYVADGGLLETGLRILDVSDPAKPSEVAFLRHMPQGEGALRSRVEDVAVAKGYAYVAAGTAGLRVVNVSDPSAPVEIGYYDTPGRADSLAISGDTVYLVDGDLRIVDVSNPRRPVEVGFYDVPDLSMTPHVAVVGPYVYLTSNGIQVLDVSSPAAPREVAMHPIPWGQVAVAGERIYVLGNGLFILRLA